MIRKRPRTQIPVKQLKQLYNETCQICEVPLILLGDVNRGGIAYSEVCHIKAHALDSADDSTNMLVLCPNHHKLFDIGIIAINPETLDSILHVDEKNELHGKRLDIRHLIAKDNIEYHYRNVYLPIFEYIRK
ncbi:HNH endonuclease [Paenibacillus harenae]|uniref:HNH endonuclease n=1 Tax=Paenibacillus harenae TaxID=306543 RepID=UPI00048D9034|nr:HNH endonuclease [Paenibacillus harenae]